MKTQRVDTWAASLEDRSGALASRLKALAAGGANLELVVARRTPDKPGQGVVFVTPITGAKQSGAAGAAGFTRSSSLHALRIEGANKPGQIAAITSALADKGLNLRGLSAAAIGKKFICHVGFDTETDVVKAVRIVRDL
jgi:hypothetical protein